MEQLSFLPTEMPHLWQALLIIVTSFIGSAVTAAFSIGGGLLLIAVMSSLLPGGAVIPVHGAIMIGSNAGRAGLLLRYIDWPIIGWFVIGAIVGATIGATIVTTLPSWIFRLLIAGFILFTQWGPKIRAIGLGPKAYALAGTISTFLTLFVGASGPFMSVIISKVAHLGRQGIIATSGACMTIQHSLKVAIFAAAGFFYAEWIPLITASLVSGLIGTAIGTNILSRLPEVLFRRVLKWMLTAMAGYLFLLVIFDLI